MYLWQSFFVWLYYWQRFIHFDKYTSRCISAGCKNAMYPCAGTALLDYLIIANPTDEQSPRDFDKLQ